MTRRGHYQTGIGLSMIAASAVLSAGYSVEYAAITLFLSMASAALPDILEIKWWVIGVRHSIIPHRTLTHWLTPWLVIAAWIAHEAQSSGANAGMAALFGVVSGAVGHIFMDWLTPMGIPVLSPYRRRSLRLIHSNPVTESGMAFLLCVLGLTLLYFNLS